MPRNNIKAWKIRAENRNRKEKPERDQQQSDDLEAWNDPQPEPGKPASANDQ